MDKKVKPTWSTFERLIRHVRPYWGRLAAGTLCGILFAGSTTGLLAAVRPLLGQFLKESRIEDILLVAALLPVLAVARGIGQFLSEYYIEWVGNRVVLDLRNAVFARLQELSVGFYTRSKTGELISRTINDTMMLERAVSSVLADLMKEPFVFLGAVGFVVWLNPKLAIASLVLFPICIVPVALFGRRVRRFAKQAQERLADLVSILQESVTGTRIVKAFGMESYECERFHAETSRFFSRIMRVVRAKAAIEPIIVVISTLGLGLVLLYARWVRLPAEDLITFAIAILTLYQPVKKLSKIHLFIQQTSASADRIFEILDTEITVKDRSGAREFAGPVESVVFEGVGFAYEAEPVLRDVSFRVRRGERVAIVGGSGAGKTTLVNLIPRFYDAVSGRVLLNGTDLREFTMKSLRGQIGLVTQDTFLFNDTVAANIAYGQADALPAAVEEAARRAHAHDFIVTMPDGYRTIIGERGLRLSGGQCQRLAIARAILRNPPILILDEATSALDTESERLVQAALETLMEGRTVFAIAHRLSTIIHSDAILVLDRGRLVESGSHEQLLAKNGVYKRLYDLQFAEK